MASFREQGAVERFEKRKIPRFPVQLPVVLAHKEDDLSSICTNLSSEGLLVETALRLTVSERLSVSVTLAPQEEPLRMVGQVVWKRELGVTDSSNQAIREFGIRFLRPLPAPWKLQSDPEQFDFEGGRSDEIPTIPIMRR